MSPPAIITTVTGHIVLRSLAGDLRYLSEIESRGHWQFTALTPEQLKELIGKNRCLFAAEPDGPLIRIPPAVISVRDRNGVVVSRRTGTITQQVADKARWQQAVGRQLYQRVRVIADKEKLREEHGYPLAREHGTVAPLTWRAQIKAQEMGWTAALPAAAGRPILGRMLRDSIKSHPSSRRAVKTMTGAKKVAREIVAHNLAVSPHPRVLAQIRRAGLPVDQVLEKAARRVIEKLERKRGAQIVAVCSTHLRDSSSVRPHLHIRMDAHDSAGKYIRLFDGQGGGGGGGRCILQDDIERHILRTIERDRERERN